MGEVCVQVCGCICVWLSGGGGQEGYVSCCDIWYYGERKKKSVYLFMIIINLNAFGVALMFFLHFLLINEPLAVSVIAL